MMALSRELAVFVAPFINSYKRYASLSWAPVNVVWGRDNRTTGFRLVGRGPALHVENRFPGGDMNAYLTYAAMIGAGLYGIEQGAQARARVQGQRLPRDRPSAHAARPVRGDRGAGAVRGRASRSSARTWSITTSTPRASSRRPTTRWSIRGTASATWSAADPSQLGPPLALPRGEAIFTRSAAGRRRTKVLLGVRRRSHPTGVRDAPEPSRQIVVAGCVGEVRRAAAVGVAA